MDIAKTEKLVIKAVNERRILKIRQTGVNFDIELEPYVEGNDFLQKKFVWGYIPFNRIFYKFYFDFAEYISITDQTFTPQTNLNYYFSDGEEHFALDESIQFWQGFGSHQ